MSELYARYLIALTAMCVATRRGPAMGESEEADMAMRGHDIWEQLTEEEQDLLDRVDLKALETGVLKYHAVVTT